MESLGLKIGRQTSQSLEAVIFDMDGVLIDSHPAHREAWKKFLTGIGRSVSDRDLGFILEGRKRAEILRHFLGDISDAEIQEHGRRKDELFQEISSRVEPVPGVIQLLTKLRKKGLMTGVATSAGRIRAGSTLNRLNLSSMFQVIVTGDDVTRGKPHPSVYQVACVQLGVEPELALAIEDSASGVAAAKGAGLQCVAVSHYQSDERLRAAGADFVIPDFGEESLQNIDELL